MKYIALFLGTLAILTTGCISKNRIFQYPEIHANTPEDLEKALENGGSNIVITLQKGLYNLAHPIVIEGMSNLVINGNGAELKLAALQDHVMVIKDCHNIKITDLKAHHTKPEGPVGCTGNVIMIEGGSDIEIRNCILNGSGLVGIAAYNTKNLKVVGCRIVENSRYPIIYQGPELTLKGNIFEDNGNGNKIAFSLVRPGESPSWPPDQSIGANLNQPGLVMKENIFK